MTYKLTDVIVKSSDIYGWLTEGARFRVSLNFL